MAGVMQSAMVASPLIYLAAEDMTRGVNAILLEEKNLQPGSIALMTTSDVKMLDGADTALDKALVPIVSLRKALKSIKGNAALLRGKAEEWAEIQGDEPQDNPHRIEHLSEQTVIQPSKKDALESGIPTDFEAALKAKEHAALKTNMLVEEVKPEHDEGPSAMHSGAANLGGAPTAVASIPGDQAMAALLYHIVNLQRASPFSHVRASRNERRIAAADF